KNLIEAIHSNFGIVKYTKYLKLYRKLYRKFLYLSLFGFILFYRVFLKTLINKGGGSKKQ
ncbi:hypothetical protein, partial [Lutibacter sp.]